MMFTRKSSLYWGNMDFSSATDDWMDRAGIIKTEYNSMECTFVTIFFNSISFHVLIDLVLQFLQKRSCFHRTGNRIVSYVCFQKEAIENTKS